MSDYISREAAIQAICNQCEANENCGHTCAIVCAIESIPAADVRPVVLGFNVDKDYPSLFECSVCGWSDEDTTTGDTRTYNFCHNCGADMKEES